MIITILLVPIINIIIQLYIIDYNNRNISTSF